MKYTRGQFTQEYYRLWELGLLLPDPIHKKIFSVKYRKNQFDDYSRVTLLGVSVCDALERACYAVSYSSPWRPEDIDLHAVYDSEENLLWLDEDFYNVVQKKGEFRGMERREFLLRFGMTSAAALFGILPSRAWAGRTTIPLSGAATGFDAAQGEQIFIASGTFTWTVPNGVSLLCVVCIGRGGSGVDGGGSGQPGRGAGGGGGGLAYKNNISTTPGNSVTVTQSTSQSSVLGCIANAGGTAIGGGAGGTPSGTYDGGGVGGKGGPSTAGTYTSGGGGAGGYSGNGGDGGDATLNGGNGSGGAAGGGGGGEPTKGGGGGGGSGLYGLGTSGLGGIGASTGRGNPGQGGSGGSAGVVVPIGTGGTGGAYGGGAATGGSIRGNPGGGAVRIIWGAGRSFPQNAT